MQGVMYKDELKVIYHIYPAEPDVGINSEYYELLEVSEGGVDITNTLTDAELQYLEESIYEEEAYRD